MKSFFKNNSADFCKIPGGGGSVTSYLEKGTVNIFILDKSPVAVVLGVLGNIT